MPHFECESFHGLQLRYMEVWGFIYVAVIAAFLMCKFLSLFMITLYCLFMSTVVSVT